MLDVQILSENTMNLILLITEMNTTRAAFKAQGSAGMIAASIASTASVHGNQPSSNQPCNGSLMPSSHLAVIAEWCGATGRTSGARSTACEKSVRASTGLPRDKCTFPKLDQADALSRSSLSTIWKKRSASAHQHLCLRWMNPASSKMRVARTNEKLQGSVGLIK